MSYFQTIPSPVLAAYEVIAPTPRETLLDVREMIFEVAGEAFHIGTIEETLRWGEPAYITNMKKTGSTLRLGIEKTTDMPALFFNCKTTLVEEFRQQFGRSLTYVKNRAVILDGEGEQYKAALKICIAAALTYHLRG